MWEEIRGPKYRGSLRHWTGPLRHQYNHVLTSNIRQNFYPLWLEICSVDELNQRDFRLKGARLRSGNQEEKYNEETE